MESLFSASSRMGRTFLSRPNRNIISHIHRSRRAFSSVEPRGKRSNLGSALGVTGILGGGAIVHSLLSQKNENQIVTIPPIKVCHDVSEKNIKEACEEIMRIVGPDKVSRQRSDLLSHSGSDFQSYAWSEQTAVTGHAVVYPATTEEVSDLVKVCNKRRIPVTPYSGGTSIEGQYIPDSGGVCIDFSRMDDVLQINYNDLDCVVQPGVDWMELNATLAEHGLFFPPDPGPGAMIGGMVATGCSGTNAAAYGTMKEWVLSLTVVLADGTIVKTRQRPRKSSAGYDLTRTFIGSEGTLGLVTEATLKLAVKPKQEAVAVCTFKTLRAATDTVQALLRQGVPVAAVELLDDVQMRSINLSGATARPWKEQPSLFFKFAGASPTIVANVADLVGKIAADHGSTSYEFAQDAAEREELWSARKNALWSMLAMKRSPTDKVWVTDVAVPISRLSDIIEDTQADLQRSGLLGSILGHVGDGNFHSLILFAEEERATAEQIVSRMVHNAISMQGTATGEHGVGLVKRDYLEEELGKTAVAMMQKMKKALDPLCLLNCNKVIRMTE